MHNLAPYAVSEGFLSERDYHAESNDLIRTPFQRDRDRIIHSKYFRRLEYKTQVFVNHLGDNFRTRLTHSLEVSQVARTIAKNLFLNEELVEALSLAHDLGHPPFGHSGERALNQLMKSFGGFNHNKQSLRIVKQLDSSYFEYMGLNLTRATLLGLRKHERVIDGMSHTLEAQIVDCADEIAYNNHDISDGLESGYITLKDLSEVSLWSEEFDNVSKLYSTLEDKWKIKITIRSLIKKMVFDLIQTSKVNFEKYEIRNINDVLLFHERYSSFEGDLVTNSRKLQQQIVDLKRFLLHKLYRHPDILLMNIQGSIIINRIFSFIKDFSDSLLPEKYLNNIKNGCSLERAVTDYISGMTDRYAISWNYRSLGLETRQ